MVAGRALPSWRPLQAPCFSVLRGFLVNCIQRRNVLCFLHRGWGVSGLRDVIVSSRSLSPSLMSLHVLAASALSQPSGAARPGPRQSPRLPCCLLLGFLHGAVFNADF